MVDSSLRSVSARRTLGLSAVVAVVLGTAAGVAAAPSVALAADGGTFSSSFESGDAAPLESTGYGDPENVTGQEFGPGSLLGSIVEVTASDENAPGEVAANVADAASGTKWLAFTSTAWLQYELGEPATVREYSLTSANDAPERDPRAWTLEGSVDGETWTELDSRSGQAFDGRGTTNEYAVPEDAQGEYAYYRLDISANGSGGIIQLADWEILDGSDEAPAPGPLLTAVGDGPISGPTIKPNVGLTGTKAYRYVGSHIDDGDATATNVVYDDLDIPIGDATELSYGIFPVLGDDLAYPATYAAVDLELSDGETVSLMSDAGPEDQYGFGASAREQGRGKVLYGSQWNLVRVDLSSLAGSTITKVLFTYDNPDGTGETSFSGWLDDIEIGDATVIDDSSLTHYVDTRRGTNANSAFSRGNNIPASAVPNGFNFFVPMTDAQSDSWLYRYQEGNNAQNRTMLESIGISHEPSPWMGDRAQLAIMPTLDAAQPHGGPDNRALPFSHDNEIAQPDYYSVELDNGTRASVTPTDHAGVYRFEFPDDADAGTVLVDKTTGGQQAELSIDASGVLSGWVQGGSGLSAGNTRMFVSGEFDTAPAAVGTAATRTSASFARFAAGSTVELRIATSFISLDQAQHNLDLEVEGRTFEDVRAAARAQWNERLGVIEVPTATDTQRVTLYSNLYRLNLYPNSQSENTGTAEDPVWQYASPVNGTEGEATDTHTNAVIRDGQIYVNNGFWDTYRTAWPLYSFLYPEVTEHLVDGFVEHYRAGGWISRWSSPGYADLMTGTSSDASFAEAYVAGALPTELALEAYDAALKNATVLPPNSAIGRKGIDTSQFLGYTSTDTHESVSWGLEGNINDAAIADMAAALADDPATPDRRVGQLREEAVYFAHRADTYGNLFDDAIGFFQGREPNGDFAKSPEQYDPTDWGGDYTETNGWNFAFHVPYDVDGLAALYGGSDGLLDTLEQFFTTPETGEYGIHEAKEARDVRIGQWGMSNQVSHHIAYIPAAAGDPSMTQEVVRETLQRLFVGSELGQGYPGDEDNGEMSSWQILSSLGFYPLALGSGEYVIGSPLYDEVIVHRGDADITIEAPGNTHDTVYVDGVSLDGEALDSVQLDQSALLDGGDHTLTFSMRDEPSDWGARASDEPRVEPRADVSGGEFGAMVVSGGVDGSDLVDDSSRTSVQLADEEARLTWTSDDGPVSVSGVTITNAADGDAPSAWRLQGSNGDGWTTIDTREGERFRWATQTRPFELDEPATYERFRIRIDATADGDAATLAEVELLASATEDADPSLRVRTGSAETGEPFGGTYATVTGGTGVLDDYSATVDFLDGEGPQPADLRRGQLGRIAVELPHTFDAAGRYDVLVSVDVPRAEGSEQVTGIATVDVATATLLEDRFANACLTVPGVAANCDSLGWALSKTALAEQGFVQGETVDVPGTDLSFDLPETEHGAFDNALGDGRTVRLAVGEGAEQLSVIGLANEGDQGGTGVITYADGETQEIDIEFGDWVGRANSPMAGNSVVAKVDGRLRNTDGSDSQDTAVYATAPIDLRADSRPLWLTLPDLDQPLNEGQIHVFAIADDGDRAPLDLLELEGGDAVATTVDDPSPLDLATVRGGVDDVTATVHWGDGTATESAEVENGVVSAGHAYAERGTYVATVVVDDGVHSAAAEVVVTVAADAVKLSAPTLSRTEHVWASGRTTLRTEVEGIDVGAVRFMDGGRILASGSIENGIVEAAVRDSVPVGRYDRIRAFWIGDGTLPAAESSIADDVLHVVKAEPKSISVRGARFEPGTRPEAVVKVGDLTNGDRPTGTVRLRVDGGPDTTVRLRASDDGRLEVRLAPSNRAVKVKAVYTPSSKNVRGATSKQIRIRLR